MTDGFFSLTSISQKRPSPVVARCGACGLFRHCTTPKMSVTGEGRLGVLVVAEAPGEQEDEEGIQLIGKSGQLFRKTLQKYGVDLDRDCWKTNSVICRPKDNRTPTDEQIESCRPKLLQTIKELNPRTIILLGAVSIKSLVGYLWRDGRDVQGISQWVGWTIPSQELNCWIVPNYHPAFLLRSNNPVLDLWFGRYLKRALDIESRPWPNGTDVPDYEKEIEKLYDSEEAATALRKMLREGGRVAFDYETNMLKPDHKDARIVSCSVCWEGKRTIAFPWQGVAVQAMSELLLSERIKKIAANNKFEERWTRRVLKHQVHGWHWDVVLASHAIDHRAGITSVKFQSFVQLGQRGYNDHIRPYLEESKDSNSPNQIHKIRIEDLLQYNGMDAILEWHIFRRQKEHLAGKRWGCV